MDIKRLKGNVQLEVIFNEKSKNYLEMPSHKTKNMEIWLDLSKELG